MIDKPPEEDMYKKAVVKGEDGNAFLSIHDGNGWIGTSGLRMNYFANDYIVSYQVIES